LVIQFAALPKVASLDAHDLVNLLAGFLLGLLPIIIPMIQRHISIRRSGIRGKYLGDFILYHWGGVVPTAIRAKKLAISLSWSGRLRAEMPIDPITNLSFRGELVIGSSGILYLDMVGVGHGEHIMIVLNSPIHSSFDLTTGVFSAIDMMGTPGAFKTILSHAELTNEQVERVIGFRQVLKAPRLPTSTLSDLDNRES
jgi:hypothetical protein